MSLYPRSLALLTDLYQLTMAYGYWKSGVHEHEAIFNLNFRKNPFGGGYAVAAGLEQAVSYFQSFRFEPGDLDYLATLEAADGSALFTREFLDYLGAMELTLDVQAMPEGTMVFPFEPLVSVKGPIIQCQLVETALLNIINFQTLIATKSARICQAAQGAPVLEFGLRRAQGVDGGVTASRAAYVGGCAGTSNVMAGRLFGIPVRGTHAHSWVMLFDDELDAFMRYAQAQPANCIFLVDTYDTLDGVRNAIEVGKKLRERGHEMLGIRLDSGDLAWLSIEARRMLDEAGFPEATIVASNDLDEYVIESLKQQGARIAVWGVGTKLATAYDQPALGGVYKLAAVREPGGAWEHRIKLSEQAIKVSTPGQLQVRRFGMNGESVADIIYDQLLAPPSNWTLVDPLDMTLRQTVPEGAEGEDLLVSVLEGGKPVYELPSLTSIRERLQMQMSGFYRGVKRFVNPHRYRVGLERSLFDLKTRLVLDARGEIPIENTPVSLP